MLLMVLLVAGAYIVSSTAVKRLLPFESLVTVGLVSMIALALLRLDRLG
jgi:hypothetical protein